MARSLAGRPALWASRLRRAVGDPREPWGFLLLLAFCAIICVLNAATGPLVVPSGLVVIPVLLSALMLRPTRGRTVIGFAVACQLANAIEAGISDVRPGGWVLLAAASVIADRINVARARIGVPGLRGESMLADLRDRLAQQGGLETLPDGWWAEVELRAAGGSSFGGDFLVSSVTDERVELVLVDVSGKGVDAATRALLLSGALGGLLGSVPPGEFLTAANDYLVRQGWFEGFATAVHLSLDPATGEFTLGSAGHPPAAMFSAGDGLWQLVEPEGPVLGVLANQHYEPAVGKLRYGDALVLYTDGVIEQPGRDLALGIDKLLGEAYGLVLTGFDGGAKRLLTAVESGSSDDAGVVLVRRC